MIWLLFWIKGGLEMVKYRIWPTGEVIEIENLKEYNMPYTGAKVLFKEKSSIAREVKTD